ncbi:ornithine cyclodeaminase [Comamonas sp. BIGb0124]|uniref:ornithine cyclodeaminase family protein n=1 Tax=Comamonas sp. BIGb0124 TaxID=2485130 RepID=UPI000F47DAE2|nr:ornithine cyclodeaminase family protein [Comamonas sp. BIGb0124]ROR23107.1 ornithine cyclodeaminase [Comamonas sp. BIGb0124]
MRHFNAEQTQAALGFPRLIDGLADAFAGEATVPLRHTHAVTCGQASGTSLLMPAWSDQGYYGLKVINIFDGNAALGLPGLHAAYILFDATTGVPLATLDGDVITAWRTAAAAALGARFLAADDARTLLIVGGGRIAGLLAQAMAAVRPIEQVRIWTRKPEQADRLARQLQQQGHRASACADLADAVAQSDIVSCATLSTEPLVWRDWLKPGSHLDLIGSFTPRMTEAAPDCFDGAHVYVDTPEALMKSGDILNAVAAGALRESDIAGTLADLCRGSVRPPAAADGEARPRTVFKAVGSAVEDLAAAVLVYESLAG